MAKQFIDGMVVEASEQVGIDIEDVLYFDAATDNGTTECFTAQEFKAAHAVFDSAQIPNTLLMHEGYRELLRLADESSLLARNAETQYSGIDESRIKTLRQARVIARSEER